MNYYYLSQNELLLKYFLYSNSFTQNSNETWHQSHLGSKHPVAILELEKKICRQNPHVEISSRM